MGVEDSILLKEAIDPGPWLFQLINTASIQVLDKVITYREPKGTFDWFNPPSGSPIRRCRSSPVLNEPAGTSPPPSNLASSLVDNPPASFRFPKEAIERTPLLWGGRPRGRPHLTPTRSDEHRMFRIKAPSSSAAVRPAWGKIAEGRSCNPGHPCV